MIVKLKTYYKEFQMSLKNNGLISKTNKQQTKKEQTNKKRERFYHWKLGCILGIFFLQKVYRIISICQNLIRKKGKLSTYCWKFLFPFSFKRHGSTEWLANHRLLEPIQAWTEIRLAFIFPLRIGRTAGSKDVNSWA